MEKTNGKMEKDGAGGRKNILIMMLIILAAAAVFLAAAAIFLIIQKGKEETGETSQTAPHAMEAEANIILDDPQSLQDAVDEMVRKAKEGYMALEMKTEAMSQDGENFSCFLANSKRNENEMFMILYLDESGEEVYRSGLIPVGARIETFTTNRKLEPGEYVCTLTYCQVEEDGETIRSQVNVGLQLNISE